MAGVCCCAGCSSAEACGTGEAAAVNAAASAGSLGIPPAPRLVKSLASPQPPSSSLAAHSSPFLSLYYPIQIASIALP